MTKQEAIKKYNLKQKNTYYELYTANEENDETIVFYTLDNQMSVDLNDSNIFYLTIQTVYKNKFHINRRTGEMKNKTRIMIIEIKE